MANSRVSAYNQAIESLAKNKNMISPMTPQSMMQGGDMRPNYNVQLQPQHGANVSTSNTYVQPQSMGVLTKQQASQDFTRQSGAKAPQQENFFTRLISALSPKKAAEQLVQIPQALAKSATPNQTAQYNADYYNYVLPNLTKRPAEKPAYVQKTLPQDMPRDISALESIIRAGLDKRGGSKLPIYEAVKDFAEAGSRFPKNLNPLTPVILALMESNGGMYTADPEAHNPFNLYKDASTATLAKYPNYRNSLFGNAPEETLNLLDQLLEGDYYQKYAETGQPTYLFDRFTPETDPSNPRNYELIDRYNQISDSLLGNINP